MAHASPTRRGVLLIDDHPAVRSALAQVINQQPDLRVCGQSGGAEDSLAGLPEGAPDVVILDLSLGDRDGIDLIKPLRERFPGVAVLVLTMEESPHQAERALRAGARGYLTKGDAAGHVVSAVRALLGGDVYLREPLGSRLLNRLFPGAGGTGLERLTRREQQVFLMIGLGVAGAKIADELRLSPKTVGTYQASIRAKLGLKDAEDVRRHAVRWIARDRGH